MKETIRKKEEEKKTKIQDKDKEKDNSNDNVNTFSPASTDFNCLNRSLHERNHPSKRQRQQH